MTQQVQPINPSRTPQRFDYLSETRLVVRLWNQGVPLKVIKELTCLSSDDVDIVVNAL
jgi:hypothetical protein